MRKADDGGIGGVNRSLPEAVLMGAVGSRHFYGSVFDGELILSVRCTDVDDVVLSSGHEPYGAPSTVAVTEPASCIRVSFPMKRRAAARRKHIMR